MSKHRSASPETWRIRPRWSHRGALALLAAAVVIVWSGQRTDMDKLISLCADAALRLAGAERASAVGDGLARILGGMFPLQLSRERATNRIENFDRDATPWGARIEVRRTQTTSVDPRTLATETRIIESEVLVEPFGYLFEVLRLMLETIEIAAWATLLAILLAAPLALAGAQAYAPHPYVLALAGAASSTLRAVPELISALLLVLIFGFGPIAGVLALGLHSAGYLGKFFAEEIDNAPRGAQQALRAAGANKAKVLRYAVAPQVLPAYLGQAQYVLERNIRTATVIGVVGAGGIGQELKGRFEMFDFAHVGTILVVILAAVLTLEYCTGRMRRRLL